MSTASDEINLVFVFLAMTLPFSLQNNLSRFVKGKGIVKDL